MTWQNASEKFKKPQKIFTPREERKNPRLTGVLRL
jgi:hypothetical protein